MPEIEILTDAQALAERAADLFARAASGAIRERGRFTVALSGGSTPEKMHRMLAEPPRAALDWSAVHVMLGDERMVPLDDPRSNYGMARRTLLDHVPIPPANVLAPSIAGTADEAAAAYEKALRAEFGDTALPPSLDLIFLGLGDDGHTASLFPGKPALVVTDRWVAGTPPGVLPPPVDRITFTFPMINVARMVIFLVAGANKAVVARDVLSGDFPLDQMPSVGVNPSRGRLLWLLDEAAAGEL